MRSTLDSTFEAGMPRSRANANVMRDMLVTQLMPQKNCPMVEMRMTALKKPELSDVWKTAPEKPPAAVIASTSLAANRNDSSRIQPPMMALTGVRFLLTLAHSRWPGTARSRLNA